MPLHQIISYGKAERFLGWRPKHRNFVDAIQKHIRIRCRVHYPCPNYNQTCDTKIFRIALTLNTKKWTFMRIPPHRPPHILVTPSKTFGTQENYQKLVKTLVDNTIDGKPAHPEITRKVSNYIACLQDLTHFAHCRVNLHSETFRAVENLNYCIKQIGLGDKIRHDSCYASEFLISVIAAYTEQNEF